MSDGRLDPEQELPPRHSGVPEGFEELAAAQAKAEEELLSKPNVNGVALGHKITGGVDTGKECLTVLVESKMSEEMLGPSDVIGKTGADLKSDIPNDVLIDVQEVGVLTAGIGALGTAEAEESVMLAPEPAVDYMRMEVDALLLANRVRPAKGGYSVGHYKITAGTIATGCYDLLPFPGIPARYYLLSNNHVLANSNDARPGDPILQPGPFDGGTAPKDVIGRLARFVPIRFGANGVFPCNYVDAAIAEVPFHLLDRQVYWIGYVTDLYDAPFVGEIVQKTGRTTNFSTGRVTNINATVMVNYGGGRVAKFCRQIVTTRMGGPGDSGSLITDRVERGVGLLFAGSSTRTIANHLNIVQAMLGVRVTEL